MIRSLIVSVALALSVIGAEAGPAVSVNLRDLDPSDPATATILADRIQTAAEKACDPSRSTADNRPSVLSEALSDRRACIRQAVWRAMAQLHAVRPALAKTAHSIN